MEAQEPKTTKPVKPIKPVTSKTNTSKGSYTPPSSPKETVKDKPNKKTRNIMSKDLKSSGVTPRLATKAVKANDGNVQGVWHSWSPGAIKDYMKQGMNFYQARSQAQEDFGFTNDPETMTGPRLNSNYWWQPDETQEPSTGGYAPNGNGGGGGGGWSNLPTPPPPMKIRIATGQRRSPYWQSEDPFIGGFEPRFVVLGDTGQW